MSAWRMVLIAVLALGVSSGAAMAEDEPFISLSTGDLTHFCVCEESCFSPTGELYYNRVDGLLLYFGVQYRSETLLHPRFEATVGWPSAHASSYYQLKVEQPVHSQDSFSFGVELYDRSAWSLEDQESISDFGNNIHAFFARIDDRDYYRSDGVTVFAQHKATSQLTLRGEYRSDALSSMKTRQHVWSVFDNDSDWDENPPLEVGILSAAREFEGRMSSYVWSAEYDSRDEGLTTGWHARGIAEFSGSAAGGDYDFRKHMVQATRSVPISETQTLSVMGLWGIGSGTDFPSNKLFHLGGRANLRGYDYKEFSGKDILFGRAEYRVQVTEPLEMIYFLESGEVAYGASTDDSNDSDGHRHDVGVGFKFDAPWAGWVRIDVARAFEEEADINVYLSLLLTH